METSNLALVADLCEKWNSGKLYEIFWEYSRLSAQTLAEKKARSWLCYENGRLSGFALGRNVKGFFVIEELWEEFEGLFGDRIKISETDRLRVETFKLQVLEKIDERPLLIRGAMDNRFAHGVARALNLSWFNGLILGAKILSERIDSTGLPDGYVLRDSCAGDEEFFSSLYREVYEEQVSAGEFEEWATKKNCKTIVASLRNRPIGFIIAEKRPYNSLGDFAIAVSPSHQRKGVGGALLDSGMNALYVMGVRMAIADYRTFNGATHALYGGRGFKLQRVYNYFWVK
jgi:GNAT superfamily N-acetyltransferase